MINYVIAGLIIAIWIFVAMSFSWSPNVSRGVNLLHDIVIRNPELNNKVSIYPKYPFVGLMYTPRSERITRIYRSKQNGKVYYRKSPYHSQVEVQL